MSEDEVERSENEVVDPPESEGDPYIDQAISMITFQSTDINMLNTITAPLEKVPSPMGEDGGDTNSKSPTSSALIASPESQKTTEDTNLNSEQLCDEKFQSIVKEGLPYTCFTKSQVALIFGIVIYIGFLGPMAGNIYIPALPLLQTEFHVSETTINSTVSVFMAVFSVGPLFWGLFADLTGRKFLYIVSLLLLTVVNILMATVPANIVGLYILRVFQAFGSSSVIALGTGTVADISPPKNRGKAIAYFMMGPNMGPILAPIISGLILIKGDHWRWLFGFTSIMSGVALLLVLAVLPETLRCIVGNGDQRWKSKFENNEIQPADQEIGEISDTIQKPKVHLFQDIGILKPVNESAVFQRLFPRPPKISITMYWDMIKFLPLTVSSLSTALLFASYYAFSVTFAHFLQADYKLSMLEVGASYVCPGIAMLLGSQTGGHLSDYLRKRWLRSHEGLLFPLEYRLILQIWGIALNTAGCIGYGWSIQRHYHLSVVLVFSALSAFGLTWCSNTTMTYLSELMARRTAGAIAVSSFFRNVGATISSAIISKLYLSMGIGWCFSGLGLCNLISLAAILYLIKYGNYFHQEFKS